MGKIRWRIFNLFSPYNESGVSVSVPQRHAQNAVGITPYSVLAPKTSMKAGIHVKRWNALWLDKIYLYFCPSTSIKRSKPDLTLVQHFENTTSIHDLHTNGLWVCFVKAETLRGGIWPWHPSLHFSLTWLFSQWLSVAVRNGCVAPVNDKKKFLSIHKKVGGRILRIHRPLYNRKTLILILPICL